MLLKWHISFENSILFFINVGASLLPFLRNFPRLQIFKLGFPDQKTSNFRISTLEIATIRMLM